MANTKSTLTSCFWEKPEKFGFSKWRKTWAFEVESSELSSIACVANFENLYFFVYCLQFSKVPNFVKLVFLKTRTSSCFSTITCKAQKRRKTRVLELESSKLSSIACASEAINAEVHSLMCARIKIRHAILNRSKIESRQVAPLFELDSHYFAK